MFSRVWHWATFYELAFISLTFLFGLQLLRTLLTGLVFYLRDAQGFSSPTLGLYALLLFLLAFLASPMVRFLKLPFALVTVSGGLALVRVVEQLTSSPLIDLILATMGIALFLFFIPIYVGGIKSTETGRLFAIAILLGIALDTAIKGSFTTMDLSWSRGAVSYTIVVVLFALHWWSMLKVLRFRPHQGDDGGPRSSLPLIGLGPILVLELLLFQNIGQQTVLTEWTQPLLFGWIVLANAIAIGVVAFSPHRYMGWPFTLVLGAGLITLVWSGPSGSTAAVLQLVGHTIVALLLLRLGASLGWSATSRGIGRLSVASGVGMLLLLVLLFSYYASYDIDIPFSRRAVAPIAAAILALGALAAVRAIPREIGVMPAKWVPALSGFLLIFLPLGYFLAYDEPSEVQGGGFPVRIMSYNLHQGFGVEGHPSIEELADAIAMEDPDIVALQEVSRGWVIDGSFDMLEWLSRRLDLPYVWGPAADSVWGNAVLSRYPVLSAETHPMPNNDELLLKRSFTSVDIDIGEGQSLMVIATHLHHPADEGYRREPQVEAILDFWDATDKTVLLGDLNAHPTDPEMVLLGEAGLKDAFIDSGAVGDGYTSRSDDPWQRIDYIWISQDLEAKDFSITDSRASDHLGIAVTVYS